MKTSAWIAGFLGVWIVLTAFLGVGHTVILVSNLIAGLFLVLAGFAMIKEKPRQGWTIGLLGFWLYLAAFLFALHSGPDLFWNNLVVGLLVGLAGFTAGAGRKDYPAGV